jgi:hypothetical protein
VEHLAWRIWTEWHGGRGSRRFDLRPRALWCPATSVDPRARAPAGTMHALLLGSARGVRELLLVVGWRAQAATWVGWGCCWAPGVGASSMKAPARGDGI